MMNHYMNAVLAILIAAVGVDAQAESRSNEVGGVCLVAECPTDLVTWSQAVVTVQTINKGALIRGCYDYDSGLWGVRVFLLDGQGQVLPRTPAGIDFMIPTGEVTPSGNSYRGRFPLRPGQAESVTVTLSQYYLRPTNSDCDIKVTFDTDNAHPDKRIVVADLWADTNLWRTPGLYNNGSDGPPFTNMIAASYDGYGSIITNIHVEVTGLVIRLRR